MRSWFLICFKITIEACAHLHTCTILAVNDQIVMRAILTALAVNDQIVMRAILTALAVNVTNIRAAW
jgi:hypothetical protein